jgi:hypothetical protein
MAGFFMEQVPVPKMVVNRRDTMENNQVNQTIPFDIFQW